MKWWQWALVALLVIGVIGAITGTEEGSDEPSTEKPTAKKLTPIEEAQAYAEEQFPDAAETDDDLAAAFSGCYLGLTGEYIGKPEPWSIEKAIRVEYPEPELQAILQEGRKDCS